MAGRLGQLKSNGGGAKTYLDSPKGVGQKTLNNNNNKGGNVKQLRRRLSVVSDNKLIEGMSKMNTEDDDATGGSMAFITGYAGVSKKGYAPYNPRKQNQDRLVMASDKETGNFMLGVWDGHGEAGHLVSQAFKTGYAEAVFSDPAYKRGGAGINTALAKHFKSIEKKVLNDPSIDTEFSGTTAVSGVITLDKKLYCANCGDSRLCLGELATNGRIVAKEVSIDHKPDDVEEKKRIEANGGRVFAVQYDDGVDGPARVWLKHMDIPGLAMSRSLGDTVAHSAGVISEAETYIVDLTNTTKTLIIASDGLWEFIDNQEALDLIKDVPRDNPEAAVDILAKESHKRWMREEQVVDDTTIAVAYFDIK